MSRRSIVLVLALALALFGTAHAASTPTPTKISAPDQARIDAAKAAYASFQARFTSGSSDAEAVYVWSRRWYDAEHEAGVKSAGADHFARMTKLKTDVAAKVSASLASPSEAAAASYYVAEATLWK